MDDDVRHYALQYHAFPEAGKLAINPTKRTTNENDLALAYSPGVAAPCEAIKDEPDRAYDYTSKGNLVAVVTNGTAVLGLGNIGPLAAKPVMEGKAVLFKKFAGVDAIDLEIDAAEPDRLVDIVAALEPGFGGINLEDIRAPECFEIERRLQARMNIPVFHDDQHGTAIVCAAAIRNYLEITGKELSKVRLVTAGAGAAAIACVNLLVALGMPIENITLTDKDGPICAARSDALYAEQKRFAHADMASSLGEILVGADIFLGLSAGGVLTPDMLPSMAPYPLILALANPEPEIRPELVKKSRPDAMIATGRSDYPNQVNNVLCFPFIFRGALDCRASTINLEMQIAAVEAISTLARTPLAEELTLGQFGKALRLGPDYLIPKPFDPRLILHIAPAVAAAAERTGVARRSIPDFDVYRDSLQRFVRKSGQIMRPVFARARAATKRIAIAQGESDRSLRAAQILIDENIAHPVLIGNREAISGRARALGLRLEESAAQVFDPASDSDERPDLVSAYVQRVCRFGVPADSATSSFLNDTSIVAATLVATDRAEGAICGGSGDWWMNLKSVLPLLPRSPDASRIYALTTIILPEGAIFLCDTHMNVEPGAHEIAEMTLLASQVVRKFGLVPRAALLSHSNFGASNSPSAKKMRRALKLIQDASPDFEVDGEMHGDIALLAARRDRLVEGSPLTGPANLLVCPNLDTAKISAGIVAGASNASVIGPILLGFDRPVHILPAQATTRELVNLAAISAASV